MYQIEFGIVHRGCLVNELSRALPRVRMICPGGFILGPKSVEELVVLDRPSEEEVKAVLDHLDESDGIAEAQVVERSADKVYIYFKAIETPESFCSQVVERNRCLKIGMEIQSGGVEQWKVGCVERADAETLIEDMKELGELTYTKITETSWENLLTGDPQ
ncbi:MAG: hypothetical protein CMJ49_05715 [Planctomycetaceae bacterium]|nr:hypothetical protein [Planctomycetaceae bacterium]